MKYTKEKRNEYQKAYRNKKRSSWLNILGGECVKCGAIKNLEFDHIDPSTKNSVMSRMYDKSDLESMIELSKCQLLCKACHDIKTKLQWETGEIVPHRKLSYHSTYGYSKGCRCEICKQSKRDSR